jgi:hypothetical protein
VTTALATLASVQVVSRRPFTAKSWFSPRPVRVGFMVDKVLLGQVYFRVRRHVLISGIPPVFHNHAFICRWNYILLPISALSKKRLACNKTYCIVFSNFILQRSKYVFNTFCVPCWSILTIFSALGYLIQEKFVRWMINILWTYRCSSILYKLYIFNTSRPVLGPA